MEKGGPTQLLVCLYELFASKNFIDFDSGYQGRNLKSLGANVSKYVKLRHVDFSHNEIEEVTELSNLPDLISINLSKNEIKTGRFEISYSIPFCQFSES